MTSWTGGGEGAREQQGIEPNKARNQEFRLSRAVNPWRILIGNVTVPELKTALTTTQKRLKAG